MRDCLPVIVVCTYVPDREYMRNITLNLELTPLGPEPFLIGSGNAVHGNVALQVGNASKNIFKRRFRQLCRAVKGVSGICDKVLCDVCSWSLGTFLTNVRIVSDQFVTDLWLCSLSSKPSRSQLLQ